MNSDSVKEALLIGLDDAMYYFIEELVKEDLLTYRATEGHLKDWLVRNQSRITGIHGYYLPNESVSILEYSYIHNEGLSRKEG